MRHSPLSFLKKRRGHLPASLDRHNAGGDMADASISGVVAARTSSVTAVASTQILPEDSSVENL
jgi:hypothetical protein